ncbi:MAG: OsmC family protein, partial [Steroidobacteraceae bacterium]
PAELGGAGGLPTPGWLLRAGLAACAATRIAMEAATEGLVLEELAVSASSTSDARGLWAMAGESGQAVSAAPTGVHLKVRVRAAGVSRERLEALIADSCRCSPVTAALVNAVPVALETDSGG